jgi:outer membrane lipase/esterase
VWAGGNDFLNNYSLLAAGQITQAQFQTNLLGAATAEVGQVGRLMGAGARYVMVFSLPDIGGTPFALSAGSAAAAAATQASAGYNTTLFTSLTGTGMRVIPVDTFSLLNEIRANPAAYGITNTTGIACGPFPPITTSGNAQFCYTGNLVAPNADLTYLFADGVHPTTAAHRIVADFAQSLVDGPVSYSMYGEVPLRTRAALVQTLADGLAIGQASGGKWSAFASMAGGNFDVEAAGVDPSFDSDNRAYSVGITMRASESVIVGGALGKTKADGTFGQDRGGFRTSEDSASIFFGVKSGGFHANGAATIANLDIKESRRTITLGTATRVAEAAPSGSNASASVSAGYDFAVGKISVGPIGAWTSQNVEVNGFEETGAGAANLRIAKQKRRSEVGSIGVRASWDLGSVTPYARITADREFKDDERFITATPISIVGGPWYDIPAYQPADSSWATIAVGVRGKMTDSVGYGLNYSKVTSRSGVSEDYITGTLSVRF